MKKVILTLMVLLLNLLTGNAQTSKLESGAVIGGGIRWSQNTHSQAAFSPLAGISVMYKFTPSFGIKTGLEYQLKGARYGGSIYYNLHYMNLPLGVTFMTDRKTKFYLFAGAYLAYLLEGINTIRKNSRSDLFYRFDTGYCIEPGIVFSLPNNFTIQSSIRYSQGVINVSKHPYGNLLLNSVLLVVGFSASL